MVKKNFYAKKWMALLLTLLLCLTSVTEGMAATRATAVSVQLMKIQGKVQVQNASGENMEPRAKMKLYNGYRISTQAGSYVWLKLDNTKLAKVDAASKIVIRKDNNVLEILLESGNIFFNVTEPLGKDETMNICTSTMVAGIRGTCGWVYQKDKECTRFSLLEGNVKCTVTNPATGKKQAKVLKGGEYADIYVYDEPKKGSSEQCKIVSEKYTKNDVPGFVLQEVFGETELCKGIYEKSGIDLRKLTAKEVQNRLEKDEKEVKGKLERTEQAARQQEKTISKSQVWKPSMTKDNQETVKPVNGSKKF